jgi:hypothetical protein
MRYRAKYATGLGSASLQGHCAIRWIEITSSKSGSNASSDDLVAEVFGAP